VRNEQVRLLYGAPAITLINLINAPLTAAVLWNVYPHWMLLSWIGGFVVVVAVRGVLWAAYNRRKPPPRQARAWGVAFTVGAALTGLLWGMLGSVVFVADDPLHLIFAAFALGGMTAGSSVRDSAFPVAFYAFAIPAVGPMVIALLLQGGTVSSTMALLLAAFSLVLMLTGRRNSRWISENILLRLEQATLNADLQAATTLMSRNLEALRRNQRDMASIAKLSDFLQACQTRDEAYPIIAMAGNRLFPGASGSLSLLSSGVQELETVTAWGPSQVTAAAFPLTDCWALRTGRRYEVTGFDTAATCGHFEIAPQGAYECLPLSVQGETLGLLHLSLPAGKRIDEDMRWLLLSFGDVIKLSLSNLKLRESLSEQALRDPLTAMFNRRYLSETLPREIRRAQREHRQLSIALIDIDHFKSFNDAWGHSAGDLVLKEVGSFLRRSLRAGDIACRYGGEEFLLVLGECDAAEAKARLARLCLEIKRKAFTFKRQPLPKITVSVGVAQLGDTLASAEALITAADQALYAAKENGRDRIEISAGPAAITAPAA
jgi:diguanylate cyclase (GGDEF)-like protein